MLCLATRIEEPRITLPITIFYAGDRILSTDYTPQYASQYDSCSPSQRQSTVHIANCRDAGQISLAGLPHGTSYCNAQSNQNN